MDKKRIDRSKGIGASEIAAVLGVSPFQTEWELYARKKGLIPPQEVSVAMEWGKHLQRAIAKVFTAQTSIPHKWWDRLVIHRSRRWQFASPDAILATSPKEILEVKNILSFQSHEWSKEDATDEGVPPHYACQCAWQMSVMELERCYLAALIGGHDFRVYKIERDPEVEAVLLEEGWRFVSKHLDADVPPPMKGKSVPAYLQKKFPRNVESIRAARGEEISWLNQYTIVRTQQSALDTVREELENLLKSAIAESDGLTWSGGRFTWKRTKDSSQIDWEALAREMIRDFPPEEQKEFLDSHSRVKHGSRRIHFSPTEIFIPSAFRESAEKDQQQLVMPGLKHEGTHPLTETTCDSAECWCHKQETA